MTASRYEVLARIATGGMGSVFVGRYRAQLGVSRLVALKRPHPFILADPRLRRRVIDEARTASAIHHANVVAVVDVELIEGEPVLVLDYVEGATLSDLVRSAAASTTYEVFAPIAVRIVIDIARGLGAAHALGILHRDVTPQNVLVGVDGVARLSDFGIAKSTANGAEPTVSGTINGKIGYLAPEVLAASEFVVSSDLFSLGVVAWEALTLQRLFGGGTDVEALARIVALVRPPLLEVAPALAPFEELFARVLARESTARPSSAAAFANELEAIASGSCGVASTADVSAFVERTFGDSLRARRAELEASHARPVREIDQIPLRPPSPRDDIETASVNDAPPRVVARTRRWPFVVVAAAVVVVVGLVGLVATRGSRARPAPIALTAVPSSELAAVPPPSAEPLPSRSADVPAASADGPRAPAPRPRAPVRAVAPKPSATGFPTHAPPNPYSH